MSGRSESLRPGGRSARGRIAVAAFPLVVWFIGSLYFLGDLGKYSDDWSLNLTNYATGEHEFPEGAFARWHWFWRPLHLLLLHANGTFLWGHDWVGHALAAVLHGGIAWAMYRFLCRAGVGSRAGAAAALVMLAHPVVYEVVFWWSAVSGLVATLMLLWLMHGVIGETPSRRRMLAMTMPAVFVTACFYEQPAGVAVLLGVLAFAKGRRGPGAAAGAAVSVLSGLACALYIGLMVATAPPGARGGAGHYHGAIETLENLWRGIERAADWAVGGRLIEAGSGAVTLGTEVMASARGTVTLIVAGVAAVAWLSRWWMSGPREERSAGAAPVKRSAILLFCAGGIVLSLLPTAAVTQAPPQPRLLYLPLMLGLVGAAVIADGASERLGARARRGLARTAGLAVVCAALLGAWCLVGYQALFRARYERDSRVLTELARLYPDPPAGATFMPVELDVRTVETGRRAFDIALPAPGNQPWASWAWVQAGYRRRDILAAHMRPGTRPTYAGATEEGIDYRSRWGTPPPYVPRGGWWIEWERAIPFSVDRHGRVRLVDRLTVRPLGKGAEAIEVRPPLVAARRGALGDDDFTSATIRAGSAPRRGGADIEPGE